jgi:hypothetical protein
VSLGPSTPSPEPWGDELLLRERDAPLGAEAASRQLRQRLERRPLLPEDLAGVELSFLSEYTLRAIYRDYYQAAEALRSTRNLAEMLLRLDHYAEAKHGVNRISIHPNPVSFLTDEERASWTSVDEDYASADLYSAFEAASMRREPLTRIAYFKTPATRPDDRSYHRTPWYVWAAAIVRGAYGGAYLFIYDCDAELDKASTMALADLGPMLPAYEAIRRAFPLRKVFIGNVHDDLTDASVDFAAEDSDRPRMSFDQNRRTGHTTRWIHTMSWMEDQPYDHGDPILGLSSPRWRSFVELEALPTSTTDA